LTILKRCVRSDSADQVPATLGKVDTVAIDS
jgi:hypothetical protein